MGKIGKILIAVFLSAAIASCAANMPQQDSSGAERTLSTEAPLPKLTVASVLHHYGEVIRGDKIRHTFIIRNTGRGDLLVKDARPD